LKAQLLEQKYIWKKTKKDPRIHKGQRVLLKEEVGGYNFGKTPGPQRRGDRGKKEGGGRELLLSARKRESVTFLAKMAGGLLRLRSQKIGGRSVHKE